MWVGWVTPDYHQHDMNFDLSKVRAVTVTMGDEQGNIHSRCGQGWGHTPVGGSHAGHLPFLSSCLPAYFPLRGSYSEFSLLLFFFL